LREFLAPPAKLLKISGDTLAFTYAWPFEIITESRMAMLL